MQYLTTTPLLLSNVHNLKAIPGIHACIAVVNLICDVGEPFNPLKLMPYINALDVLRIRALPLY